MSTVAEARAQFEPLAEVWIAQSRSPARSREWLYLANCRPSTATTDGSTIGESCDGSPSKPDQRRRCRRGSRMALTNSTARSMVLFLTIFTGRSKWRNTIHRSRR